MTPSRNAATGSVLARASRVFRDGGFRALWFGSLAEIGYRRLLVLERPLDAPAPRIATSLPAQIVRLDDPREYCTLRPDTTEQAFLERRQRGMECFVAFCGDRPVSSTWASPGGGKIPYLRRDFEIDPDDVYLVDSYTLPSLRGKGFAPAVAAAQIEHYRRAGKRRLLALVLPENRASLRARARSGFHTCGVIGYVGIGGLRHDFVRASRRPLA